MGAVVLEGVIDALPRQDYNDAVDVVSEVMHMTSAGIEPAQASRLVYVQGRKIGRGDAMRRVDRSGSARAADSAARARAARDDVLRAIGARDERIGKSASVHPRPTSPADGSTVNDADRPC